MFRALFSHDFRVDSLFEISSGTLIADNNNNNNNI